MFNKKLKATIKDQEKMIEVYTDEMAERWGKILDLKATVRELEKDKLRLKEQIDIVRDTSRRGGNIAPSMSKRVEGIIRLYELHRTQAVYKKVLNWIERHRTCAEHVTVIEGHGQYFMSLAHKELHPHISSPMVPEAYGEYISMPDWSFAIQYKYQALIDGLEEEAKELNEEVKNG